MELTSLLLGQTVRLEFDAPSGANADDPCADVYGRTLAYVWVPDGDPDDDLDDRFVNQEMVLRGFVRVYEEFDDIRLADLLYTAEQAARDAGVGLWGACE